MVKRKTHDITPDCRKAVFVDMKVPGVYDLHYENGVKLGEIVAVDDGYHVFFPERGQAYMTAELSIAIGQTLLEMNKPWDKQVRGYFKKERDGRK